MAARFFVHCLGRVVRTLLFPRRTFCLACSKLTHGECLCPACTRDMNLYHLQGDLCPLCGHALLSSPCSFCKGEAPGRMRSAWKHRGAPRQLILRLKHGCVTDAAALLATGLAECAQALELPPDTVVTWVTMPATRRRRRGIDHSRLLAEETARLLRLPCRQLLLRADTGHTQRGLGRKARLRNLQGLFSCNEAIRTPVLLVDDVTTTSATARVCTDVLLQAGATQVMVVTATQA